jgi:N-acetyl sugar amidotransferase
VDRFDLIYCTACLTPNTRPNGQFNAMGICSACEYYSSIESTDFDLRIFELRSKISELTSHRKSRKWDCIVGVSGGKDSTRQALWVRDKLGLRPLLVSVMYPPMQVSEIGARNLSNLISLGFDCVAIGPAPQLSRQLVREAFFRFANWCKATEMALFAGVPQVALERGIDLILWGENGAIQVGDYGVYGSDIWDGNQLRNSNTLAGGELEWFLEVSGSLDKLAPYRFPDATKLRKNQVQTIFLGPAWSDWSNTNNSQIALVHGLSIRDDEFSNTGDMYGTEMIDEDWTIVNNLLKYYKLGFSRGTEQANSLIRSGVISRAEGIQIAQQQDPACGNKYIANFCSYIDIEESEFWTVVRKFANPELFKIGTGKPQPLFRPGIGFS